MGVIFIKNILNFCYFKKWKKIQNKIAKFGVENFEHLRCVEKFEAEILKKNLISTTKNHFFEVYEVNIWYQCHKNQGTGWMDGWVEGKARLPVF